MAMNNRIIIFFTICIAAVSSAGCQGGNEATQVGNPPEFPLETIVSGVTLPPYVTGDDRFESPVVKQPAAMLWEPLDVLAGTDFCFDDPIVSAGTVGPYSTPLDADDFHGSVFYVDDDAAEDGDGSREHPFNSIGQATWYAHFTAGVTSAILVAGGTYSEPYPNVIYVWPGQYLFGGFEASTWSRNLTASPSIIRVESAFFSVFEANPANYTIIDGFTFYNEAGDGYISITLGKDSRVTLRHNIIYAGVRTLAFAESEYFFGLAVVAHEAFLHAYNNLFVVPSDTPSNAESLALDLYGSCEIVFNNHFVGYDTPLRSSSASRGSFIGNLIEDGYSGVSTTSESLVIRDNTFGVQRHGEDRWAYAVGSTAQSVDAPTHPFIENNIIILQGGTAPLISVSGIFEEGMASDPASLMGNRFVLLGEADPMLMGTVLYFDVDRYYTDPPTFEGLVTIEEVNAMTDIPSIGGNTIEFYAISDLGL